MPKMAEVESMSDDEIRSKLSRMGISCPPITGSTRDVLIRKLKKAMASAASSSSVGQAGRAAQAAARRSRGGGMDDSASESDDSVVTGSSRPAPSHKRGGNSSRRRSSTDEARLRRRSSNNNNSLMPTPTQPQASSDVFKRPLPPCSPTPSTSASGPAGWRMQMPFMGSPSNHLLHTRPGDEFDTGSETESGIDTRLLHSRRVRASRPSTHRGGRMMGAMGSAFTSMVESFRATTRIGNGVRVPPTQESSSDEDDEDEEEQPSFRKAHSSTPNGHCSNSGGSGGGKVSVGVTSGEELFRTVEEEAKFWNSQSISRTLLLVVFFFFVFLAITYWSKHMLKDRPYSPTSTGYNFTLCTARKEAKLQLDDCIPKNSLVHAMRLFKILHPDMVERTRNHMCGVSEVLPNMSLSEAEEHLAARAPDMEKHVFQEAFESLKVFVSHNPALNLRLVDEGGKPAGIGTATAVGPVGLAIPFRCWVWQQAIKLAANAAEAIFGMLIVAAVYWLIRWWDRRRRLRENEVFELVEQILNILRAHQLAIREECSNGSSGGLSSNSPSYLPVNHVRDQLILPQDRAYKASLWLAAVEYLRTHESRVRQEMQQVAGEDCLVWRWLSDAPLHRYSPPHHLPSTPVTQLAVNVPIGGSTPTISPLLHPSPTSSLKPHLTPTPKLPTSGSKVWQGQAFEMRDGSVNPLPTSSTPFLKIRNMFDPDVEYGVEWTVRIQDAILEKCELVHIIHIGVQKSSPDGCVYVKCASREDARDAYHALHGWWFDGNLVTVKYLRGERYHEHFPNARKATLPLQPSNDKRLSLRADFQHGQEEEEGEKGEVAVGGGGEDL